VIVDPETNTHYFFWLSDGYKLLDYEPIQVREVSGRKILVSRAHYSSLTIWLDPLIINGKPVIRFCDIVHTPICLSRSKIHFGEIRKLAGIDKLRLELIVVPFFMEQIDDRLIDPRKISGYSDRIVHGKPPKRFEFKVEDSRSYFAIGREPPVPGNLPSDIRALLWPNKAYTNNE